MGFASLREHFLLQSFGKVPLSDVHAEQSLFAQSSYRLCDTLEAFHERALEGVLGRWWKSCTRMLWVCLLWMEPGGFPSSIRILWLHRGETKKGQWDIEYSNIIPPLEWSLTKSPHPHTLVSLPLWQTFINLTMIVWIILLQCCWLCNLDIYINLCITDVLGKPQVSACYLPLTFFLFPPLISLLSCYPHFYNLGFRVI